MRAQELASFPASLALLLALFGFGAKAGIVPLHVWLPEAHPAAPSPVSALMSAVMLKTAVYGFLRVSLDLLHAPVWWWRSEEHTSELQSLMRISYAVFCLKKKNDN